MTYLDSIYPKKNSNLTKKRISRGDNISTHNFILPRREAKAASPELAVCGEEDPGEGLEFLVTGNSESDQAH